MKILMNSFELFSHHHKHEGHEFAEKALFVDTG